MRTLFFTLILSTQFLSLTSASDVMAEALNRCEQALAQYPAPEVAVEHAAELEPWLEGLRNLGLPWFTSNGEKQNETFPYDDSKALSYMLDLIRGISPPGSPASELLAILRLKETMPELSRAAHRAKVQAWVEAHVPGFRIAWKEDLPGIAELVRSVSPYGNENLGVRNQYGTVDSLLYHWAIRRGYIPVLNQHDLLGHVLAMSVPGVAEVTRRLSGDFAAFLLLRPALEWANGVGRSSSGGFPGISDSSASSGVTDAFVTLWNKIQEMLVVFSPERPGAPARVSLLGGLNTLFNYIYDPAHGGLVGAHGTGWGYFPYLSSTELGFIHDALTASNEDLAPQEVRKGIEDVREAARRLTDLIEQLNVPDLDKTYERDWGSYARFGQISDRTLFRHQSFHRRPDIVMPFRERLQSFADQLSQDPALPELLKLESRIQYWNAILDLLEAWIKKERRVLEIGYRPRP